MDARIGIRIYSYEVIIPAIFLFSLGKINFYVDRNGHWLMYSSDVFSKFFRINNLLYELCGNTNPFPNTRSLLYHFTIDILITIRQSEYDARTWHRKSKPQLLQFQYVLNLIAYKIGMKCWCRVDNENE